MSRTRFSSLVALLVALGMNSCQQLAVCDGEPGSCLLLHVNGEGTYANLRSVATVRDSITPMQTGSIFGPVTLPVLLKFVPPDGVAASDITQLRVEGLDRNNVSQVSGTLNPMWDNGSHVERDVTVTLDPVIASVSPMVGPSSGSTPLVVTGRGFDADAQLLIGSQAVGSLQRISEKELRGTLPQSPSKLGAVDLVVRNRDGKTATSAFSYYPSTLDFYAMKAVATRDYDDRKEYSPGSPDLGAVQPMTVGDFDGDGLQDIAAVNWHNVTQSVSFLWGDGKGGFPARTDVDLTMGTPLAGLLRPLAILAVKNPVTQNTDFMVAFNEKTSSKFARIPGMASRQAPMMLSAAQILDSGNPYPISILAANMDSSPDLEVILVGYGEVGVGVGGFSVHKYNASGALELKGSGKSSGNPTQALAFDWSKDGRMDLVLVNHSGGTIEPFLNISTGAAFEFTNKATWPVGTMPSAAVTDFDGDGNLELVVSISGDKLSICHVDNNGQKRTIAVSPGCEYGAATPSSIVAAEGRIAWAGLEYFSVMKNPLSGTGCLDNTPLETDPRLSSYYPKPLNIAYSPLTTSNYPAPERVFDIPSTILAADVNGDLKQDYLVYAAKSGSIFLGLTSGDDVIAAGNGRFDEVRFASYADTYQAIGSVFDASAGVITKQPGESLPILAFVTGPGSIGVRPLDARDPFLSSQSYKRFLGAETEVPNRTYSSSVKVTDIDGDGQLDVVAAVSIKQAEPPGEFQSAAKVFWSLELGNPFQAETTTGFVDGGRTSKEGGNGESLVAVGDLDNDGATDLVLSSVTRKKLSILYQDPTQKRTFGQPIDIALGPTLSSAPLALGDIDGDGYTDVIVGNKNNGVSVLCGNKTRTHSLRDATLALTGNSVTQIALADMDNDAAHDLDIVLTLETGEILVLLNPGEPQKKKTCAEATAWMTTPQNQVRLKLGSTDNALRYLESLLVADLNGDALPEIVVSHKTGPLTVFQNTNGRDFDERLLLQNSTAGWGHIVAIDQNQDGLLDLYTTRSYGLTFFRNTSH